MPSEWMIITLDLIYEKGDIQSCKLSWNQAHERHNGILAVSHNVLKQTWSSAEDQL